MKEIIIAFLLTLAYCFSALGQNESLTPQNAKINLEYLKPDTSTMSWYFQNDSLKMDIGIVKTQIENVENQILIITHVEMERSVLPWVDTTILSGSDLTPIYHSSYNDQRDMIINYGSVISGYYFDKQTDVRVSISEKADKSFYDSSSYMELIRLLPLKTGYTKVISIFDYNPKAKIGVISARITSTEEVTLNHEGQIIEVWKVKTTNDISNNASTTVLYIEKSSRKLIRKEVLVERGVVVMELKNAFPKG